MKQKIFLLFLLFLLPFSIFSLNLELAKKIDSANDLYLQKKYQEALVLYEEFLSTVEYGNLKTEVERQIYTEIALSSQEIKDLILFLPILPLFQQVSKQEKENQWKEARDNYFIIWKYLKEKSIGEVKDIFPRIVDGSLEEFYLKQKKERLGNTSYTLIEQIKIDKKRKKSVAFMEFQKDKGVNFDLEELLKNAFLNQLERNNYFIINPKAFYGTPAEKRALIEQKKIDFIISGSYRMATANSVLLIFSVSDAINGKKLMEATVRAPLNIDFFDTIARLVLDMELNLRDYSRLEEFDEIRYTKEAGKEIVKQVLSAKKEKKDRTADQNLLHYVEQKILESENKYVSFLVEQASKSWHVLFDYNKVGLEIAEFNQRDFPLKLDYDFYFNPPRQKIKERLIHDNRLFGLMRDLTLSAEYENYDAYFSHYDKAKSLIKKMRAEWIGLEKLINEIEEQIEKDKKEIDSRVAILGQRIFERSAIILGISFFNFDYDNEEIAPLKNDLKIFSIGYGYQRQIYQNFWYHFGIGIHRQNYQADKIEAEIFGLFLDFFHLKYFVLENANFYSGVRSNFYFVGRIVNQETEERKAYEIEEPTLYWILGTEYIVPIFRNFDLAFNIKKGINILPQKFYISWNQKGRKSLHFTEVSLHGYFNTYTYNVKTPESFKTGLWFSFLMTPIPEWKTKLDGHSFKMRNIFASGLGIGYQFYDTVTLCFDTIFFSSSEVNNNPEIQGKIRILNQNLFLEADVLSYRFLHFFVGTGLGYVYTYDSYFVVRKFNSLILQYFYEESHQNGFQPLFYPLIVGIKINLFHNMNIKLMGFPPAELTSSYWEMKGIIKIEFKL